MPTTPPARQPAGVPVGGQFAPAAHAEGEVDLEGGDGGETSAHDELRQRLDFLIAAQERHREAAVAARALEVEVEQAERSARELIPGQVPSRFVLGYLAKFPDDDMGTVVGLFRNGGDPGMIPAIRGTMTEEQAADIVAAGISAADYSASKGSYRLVPPTDLHADSIRVAIKARETAFRRSCEYESPDRTRPVQITYPHEHGNSYTFSVVEGDGDHVNVTKYEVVDHDDVSRLTVSRSRSRRIDALYGRSGGPVTTTEPTDIPGSRKRGFRIDEWVYAKTASEAKALGLIEVKHSAF